MTLRRGFTLIELMVVVAIIALLISITMPAMSEARRVSKKSVCLNNLHQIGTGIHAYLQVNRDTFPHVARFPTREWSIAQNVGRIAHPTLPIAFSRELGGRPPSNLQKYMQDMSNVGRKGDNSLFECPADVVDLKHADTAPPIVVRAGDRYYNSQTTSYEWENTLDGVRLQFKSLRVIQELLSAKLKDVWMVFDYEPFHGGPYRRGTHNVLYADFHVQSDQWIQSKAVGRVLVP